LAANAAVTEATTGAERKAAIEMLRRTRRKQGATLGADKVYDDRKFVTDVRQLGVTRMWPSFDAELRAWMGARRGIRVINKV
jgi:hypothetical protein